MSKNFNKVFRTEDGRVFFKVKNIKEVKPEGNFIYADVENKKVLAMSDGKPTAVPDVLINEIGTKYHHVVYSEIAKVMRKKHGYYYATKCIPIRVWKNIKPGEVLRTVIDNYEEHSITLTEEQVAAQNMVKNEFYGIPKTVLAEKYVFDHSEFDYDVYVPKDDAVSVWVYCDMNVFGQLYDGIEFLTTPMINISNPDDVYGCNYVVWWGNDGTLASYKVLGYVRACKQEYYPRPQGDPVSVSQCTFEPPKSVFLR